MDIKGLLEQGLSYTQIQTVSGLSKATISYHAKKYGLSSGRRNAVDWVAVKVYYDAGHTVKQCMQKFGFASGSWAKAVIRGVVKGRGPTPLEEWLKPGTKVNRFFLKRKMIKAGLLKNECSECYMPPLWNGKNLVFVLDHRNGVKDDNTQSNLRLLCPNCNSQTDTFSGRNIKRRKAPSPIC